MAAISDIEGIGPALEKKFRAAGIKTTQGLLKACCDRQGRRSVAAKTGIEESRLLRFANFADLYRVRGVGSEYSELLEAAGVDTVKALRNRNAGNLRNKMLEINQARKLVRQVPSLSQVEGYIASAKTLDPVVTH